MPFKCFVCHIILLDEDVVKQDGLDICPVCATQLIKMCDEDHLCQCTEELTGGTQKCPVCGEFTCPCGSHDAFVISRVTGYLGELSGWNNGKRAEFADRTRYDVA
jgi:anaerobic ribonucleoside-triphosphate reductase